MNINNTTLNDKTKSERSTLQLPLQCAFGWWMPLFYFWHEAQLQTKLQLFYKYHKWLAMNSICLYIELFTITINLAHFWSMALKTEIIFYLSLHLYMQIECVLF